jgi:glutathione-regulated potassium-efflux system ancillary protein KefC
MGNTWSLCALWGLALAATLLGIWFRISTALTEIGVGTVAQLTIGAMLDPAGLLGSSSATARKVSTIASAPARKVIHCVLPSGSDARQ